MADLRIVEGCREFLGVEKGWCGRPRANDDLCFEHLAERREWKRRLAEKRAG